MEMPGLEVKDKPNRLHSLYLRENSITLII